MKLHSTLIFLLILLCSCGQKKQETVVTPWGEIADTIPTDDSFDLDDIQRNGELIALTLTGPETYYDYRGKHLGAQYLLAQKFADKLGVSLRMEVCRDSAEMLQRLNDGEADLICYPMTKKGLGWLVGADKEDLEQELKAWYRPGMLAEVKKEEEFLLSNRAVRRRVFAPMLNRAGGVISHYDGFFQRYASTIRWDWRLLAAQCYQESTFDPKARSWAGACGLMQIMPGTADHLGLSRANIYDPEQNIAAAVRSTFATQWPWLVRMGAMPAVGTRWSPSSWDSLNLSITTTPWSKTVICEVQRPSIMSVKSMSVGMVIVVSRPFAPSLVPKVFHKRQSGSVRRNTRLASNRLNIKNSSPASIRVEIFLLGLFLMRIRNGYCEITQGCDETTLGINSSS